MSYLGQCNTIRQTNEGELMWQQIMAKRQPITIDTFINFVGVVDFSAALLNDGENVENWFSEALREDGTTQCFFSQINESELNIYFVQTCGFEFIFTASC